MGDFRFLVLEGARSQGLEMAVIALKEEASQELEKLTSRIHWVSLGELSKAIDLMHQEGVTRAVMAGQVKHNKIFSSIRPDWKLAKLLFALPRKNTDSLIGAVARVLEDEGIQSGGFDFVSEAAGAGSGSVDANALRTSAKLRTSLTDLAWREILRRWILVRPW